MTGIFFALVSAVVWGTGDFLGGLAARRSQAFQVVLLAAISGFVSMALLAAARQEGLPSLVDVAWSALAGTSGVLGIALLYYGLAQGNAALVSPTAGVIGAAVPALVGSVQQGFPGWAPVAGFALGLAGIWGVSRSPTLERNVKLRGLGLALTSGMGFGGFFVCIAQVEAGAIFIPLVVSKLAAIAVASLVLRLQRVRLPAMGSNFTALAAGFFDAGGNIFYLLAENTTRLDIAAVLSSMYPAATVLLAGIVLKERVSRGQWLGVILCIAAVALIAL